MSDGNVSYKNVDEAIVELQRMADVLDTLIKRGNFTNDDIVALIKAWSRVNLLSGLNVDSWGYWIFKREPSPSVGNEKRSHILARSLDIYLHTLKPGKESGDDYRRAERALLDLVYEYRNRIAGNVNRETDFVQQLLQLRSEGRRGLMEEAMQSP
ncbi:MAG TPA: hypothetical protein VMG82_38555 [Candidatus Sulfotelmatobacter sp.]|nr:hypothetical protein [Candidatus Sulfotelmatobacter sp.]